MMIRHCSKSLYGVFVLIGMITVLTNLALQSLLYSSEPPSKSLNEVPQPQQRTQITTYDGPARTFVKFDHPFPCYKSDKILMAETPATEGLLFQRPHKVGSTTVVGIVMRLAHNRAKLMKKEFERCKFRALHGPALGMYHYAERDRTKSFLFSILRDPTKRAISEFFHFDVTAGAMEPTDEHFIQKLRRKGFNYYINELVTREYITKNDTAPSTDEFAKSKGYDNTTQLKAAIQSRKPGAELLQHELSHYKRFGPNNDMNRIVADILEDYDFIAILERLDESLVVMQMLLGLTTKEILYSKARSSGSFSNGPPGRPCFYIMPSFLSSGMEDYFASDEWHQMVEHDLMIYQAANKSLDLTIEALGREEFETKLAELRRGLKLANENCKGRVKGMCSEGGKVIPEAERTCYIWSEGCDHDCVDELDF